MAVVEASLTDHPFAVPSEEKVLLFPKEIGSRPLLASLVRKAMEVGITLTTSTNSREIDSLHYLAPYLRESRDLKTERQIEIQARDREILNQRLVMSIALQRRRNPDGSIKWS